MKLLKSLFLLAAVTLLMTGCIKPPKVPDVKEIKPNETAWVIPLDAQTQAGQAKFNSVDFLNQKKVAAKRIWIDKTEKPIGRFSWEIEWVPSVRVITVDRTLVTANGLMTISKSAVQPTKVFTSIPKTTSS
jgi:hypothetical protein